MCEKVVRSISFTYLSKISEAKHALFPNETPIFILGFESYGFLLGF